MLMETVEGLVYAKGESGEAGKDGEVYISC